MHLNRIAANSSAVNTANVNSEIVVNTVTGEAYISQRKAAELLGVVRDSLKSYLERNVCTQENREKLEISQGLSSEIFANAIQYYALDARNPTEQAKLLLKQIASAGAKAYLYHMAGYTMNASVNEVKPKETEQLGYLDDATVVVKRELELHSIFGTPLHLAQIESVKMTETITGVDLSRLLVHAPAQQNIREDDVMLEPKELAVKLGLKSAIALNKKLIDLGLQSRIDGELVATDEALGMFTKHAWKKGGKSGYNYKWNLGVIRSKLT